MPVFPEQGNPALGTLPSSGEALRHDTVVDDRTEIPDAVIGPDGVYPVGQKDYDIHAFPVDPDRCPGIPEMTDRIRRKEIPGGRSGCRGVPPERPWRSFLPG